MSSDIDIGTNIKRLRKARGVTQEALADSLGISYQAVSKWERGEGYPDITMLPPLARVFGVTLDDLIGMNALRDTADAQKLLETSYANGANGETEANVVLLREGVKRFPANDEMWCELARNLRALRTDKGNEEAVDILEHVLSRCTDSGVRNRATAFLCEAYAAAGLREKAAAMAHVAGAAVRAAFRGGLPRRRGKTRRAAPRVPRHGGSVGLAVLPAAPMGRAQRP